MDFNHNQQHVPGRPQPEPFVPNGGSKRKKRFGKPSQNGVANAALVLIVVLLVVFGLLWLFRGNNANEAGQINKDEYQAVFLSNGQVYFGHLETLNSQYAKLTGIYYLQVKQAVQPKQSTDTTSQSNNVQLVKLGNELHGPEDAMQINRQQMVFWENLKSSGKVTQAIKNYQKNGGNTNATSTPTTTTPSPTTTQPSSTSSTPSGTNSSSPTSTSTTPTTNKP